MKRDNWGGDDRACVGKQNTRGDGHFKSVQCFMTLVNFDLGLMWSPRSKISCRRM